MPTVLRTTTMMTVRNSFYVCRLQTCDSLRECPGFCRSVQQFLFKEPGSEERFNLLILRADKGRTGQDRTLRDCVGKWELPSKQEYLKLLYISMRLHKPLLLPILIPAIDLGPDAKEGMSNSFEVNTHSFNEDGQSLKSLTEFCNRIFVGLSFTVLPLPVTHITLES